MSMTTTTHTSKPTTPSPSASHSSAYQIAGPSSSQAPPATTPTHTSTSMTTTATPGPSSTTTTTSAWTDPPWSGWIETTLDALIILEAARRGLIPRVTRRLVDAERRMISSGAVFVFDEDESGIKRWTDGFFWSPSRILGNFLLYRETEKRGGGGRRAGVSGNANVKESEKLKGREEADGGLLVDETNRFVDQGSADTMGGNSSLSRPKGDPSATGLDKQRERSLMGSLTNSYKFKPDGMMKKTFSLTLNGITHHLISYYKIADVSAGRLRTPSSLPELAALDISPEYLEKTHFRCPPRVEVGRDGRLRYRGEGDESGGGGSADRGNGQGNNVGGTSSAAAGQPSSSHQGTGYGASSSQMTVAELGGNGMMSGGARYTSTSHPHSQDLLSLESNTSGQTHDFPGSGHISSPHPHAHSTNPIPSSDMYAYPPHPHEIPHLPLGPSHGSPQYSRKNRAERRYDPYSNSYTDTAPGPHPLSLSLTTGASSGSVPHIPMIGRTVKKVRKRTSGNGKASEGGSGSSVSPVAIAVAGSGGGSGSGSYAPHQQMQQYSTPSTSFAGYSYPSSNPSLGMETGTNPQYYSHGHGHMDSPHIGSHSLHHSISLPHNYYQHPYEALGAGSGVRERPRTPPPLPSIAGSAAPENPNAAAVSSSPAMSGGYTQSPSPVHAAGAGYYNSSHSNLGVPISSAGGSSSGMWGSSSGHGHGRTLVQSNESADPVMGSLPPMAPVASGHLSGGVRKIEEEERYLGGHVPGPAAEHGHGFIYDRRPGSAFGGLNSAGSANTLGMGMGVPL